MKIHVAYTCMNQQSSSRNLDLKKKNVSLKRLTVLCYTQRKHKKCRSLTSTVHYLCLLLYRTYVRVYIFAVTQPYRTEEYLLQKNRTNTEKRGGMDIQ